jgi:hypothetical protein
MAIIIIIAQHTGVITADTIVTISNMFKPRYYAGLFFDF